MRNGYTGCKGEDAGRFVALEAYRRKRDFSKTPEPEGKVAGGAVGGLRFVVQKHAARRLHYDFRLEWEGVLKSWAVPKGPSLDPAQKRLAVQVEDHPLDYGGFEGTIPEGEYGGGTVLLWDRGMWRPLEDAARGLADGKLKFELEGEKLRGRWALVRTRTDDPDKPQWLLMKERDGHARGPEAPDILEERPESVQSGRSLEEIAREPEATWGRAEPVPLPRKAAPKRVRAGPPEEDGAAVEAASVAGEVPAAFPEEVPVQLATLTKEAPEGREWLHEIKYDGYRLLAYVRRGSVRMVSRNGLDWTHRFGRIVAALRELPVREAVLDGEAVVLAESGASDFQTLQRALKGEKRKPVDFVAFDLLYLNGADLRGAGLLDRKAALRRLLEAAPAAVRQAVRYSDHVEGEGRRFYEEACKVGLEGVVSKRRDSAYAGGRAREWLKTKCVKRQEFVVGGYTDPEGSRTGFGALLVGARDEAGALVYCGKVGTGFNARELAALHKELAGLERADPPFRNPPRGAEARGVHWVEPRLVVEVAYFEMTVEGMLRHPSFQGSRADKAPAEVVLERPGRPEAPETALPAPAAPQAGAETVAARKPRGKRPAGRKEDGTVEAKEGEGAERAGGFSLPQGVELTHPEKVLFAEAGVTKGGLAAYYHGVAPRLLPWIAGRPLALVRCPEGAQKACFFQKHFTEAMPPGLLPIDIKEKEEKAPYAYLEDESGVMALVQRGVLEIHPWGCRVENPEWPDQLIFDLDPGEGVPWGEVLGTALLLRAVPFQVVACADAAASVDAPSSRRRGRKSYLRKCDILK